MIIREAGGQGAGSRLLHFSGMVFRWWRRYQAGSIRRTTLRDNLAGLCLVIRLLLESGRDGPCR